VNKYRFFALQGYNSAVMEHKLNEFFEKYNEPVLISGPYPSNPPSDIKYVEYVAFVRYTLQ